MNRNEYDREADSQPLKFHWLKAYVTFESDGFRAVTSSSTHKGLAFGDRPISINERVIIQQTAVKLGHEGTLSFGFLAVDPVNFNAANCDGNHWLADLPQEFIRQGGIVKYSVTTYGDVKYSIDGIDKGVIMNGVCTGGPLWAIFSFGGAVTSIDFETIGNELVRETETRTDLTFHLVCGENVRLEQSGSRAVRKSPHADGIVFSNRHVSIGELVCIRQTSTNYRDGSDMSFGFSSLDPAWHAGSKMLKFDTFDSLVEHSHFWVGTLPKGDVSEGALVQFSVSREGVIVYSINGGPESTLLRGVDTRTRLWVVVGLYASARAVDLVPANDISRLVAEQLQSEFGREGRADRQVNRRRTRDGSLQVAGQRSLSRHPPSHSNFFGTVSDIPAMTHVGFNREAETNPLVFHSVCGNVTLKLNGRRAVREISHADGVAFSHRPISIGETVNFLQFSSASSYGSDIHFGFTTFNPSKLDGTKFVRHDSYELIREDERFWINVWPKRLFSECVLVQFSLSKTGKVVYSINCGPESTLLSGVNTNFQLWAVFGFYGPTNFIELVSTNDFSRLLFEHNQLDIAMWDTFRRNAGDCSQQESMGRPLALRGSRRRRNRAKSRVRQTTSVGEPFSSSAQYSPAPTRTSASLQTPAPLTLPEMKTTMPEMFRSSNTSSTSLHTPPPLTLPEMKDSMSFDAFRSLPRPSAPVQTPSLDDLKTALLRDSATQMSSLSTGGRSTTASSDGNKKVKKSSTRDGDDCSICLDDTAATVIFPCKHMCMCVKCADKVKRDNGTCPFCRRKIDHFITIYRS